MHIRERKTDNLVIGSGAAGFAASLRLLQLGERNTVLATDHVNAGTSRNTGSDKQTYYKLSLAGDAPDSVRQMARDLFRCQCVDGDTALAEAVLSARCFYWLAEMGVPFPSTEFDEFMGYRTDHDASCRATSAGPYTSRMMTEALEKRDGEEKLEILDGRQLLKILTHEGRALGALFLVLNGADAEAEIVWADNVILATGAPAGMYRDSVYPTSQIGGSGAAFEAGAAGKNLTEWQFGLASKNPRWNVSGTYMQVLPRFVSTDEAGGDEREFLAEYYPDRYAMLGNIFLKGYQWPFDASKASGGSSEIDLFVYRETVVRKRRVFLDFTKNPGIEDIDFTRLPEEASQYLAKAGADFGKPIDRLEKMNQPAAAFYREHGIDLRSQRLEIALCAQHNNGGLAGDASWESSVSHLFAVGEVNGSHGVTRPGGTALNAGQCGALRAAECIRIRHLEQAAQAPDEEIRRDLRRQAAGFLALPDGCCGTQSVALVWRSAAERMSRCGGVIREEGQLKEALSRTREMAANLGQCTKKPSGDEIGAWFRLRDMLISQIVYLSAMLNYCQTCGASRGSALYMDASGERVSERLPEQIRCRPDAGKWGGKIQEARLDPVTLNVRCTWRPVRPIPDTDYFFENQWRKYRERWHINS